MCICSLQSLVNCACFLYVLYFCVLCVMTFRSLKQFQTGCLLHECNLIFVVCAPSPLCALSVVKTYDWSYSGNIMLAVDLLLLSLNL